MAKGPDAFRTISEAAAEVGVPAHVLRFWESRLPFIKPMKRAGGRRFYRPQDVATLRAIHTLLHGQGLSLKAVQTLHRSEGVRGLVEAAGRSAPPPPPAPTLLIETPDPAALSPPVKRRLRAILGDLEAVQARVDQLLRG